MLKAKPSPHFLVVVLFCLLTIGMTWPLILRLHTHVTPGQQPAMTVPYLNLWTLAWNHHWLQGQADSYWNANQFFPHQKTLAYSEPQLGIALLTFPVVFFGGNTVLAYNLALLLFFFGAGMAVYALCWWLFGLVREIRQTDRGVASITAGILYTFTPYMFREIGVLQLLATLFPPLCLLGLHRFFYQKQWASALLFCIGFLGCWYTCAYYGLFLSVFVGCFIIFFSHRNLFHKQNLILGLGTAAILTGGLLPLAHGMHTAKAALSLERSTGIVRALSAASMEYLQLPSSSLLYEQILGWGSLGNSRFLGGMLLCLASLGAVKMFRSPIMTESRSTDSKTLSLKYQTRPLLRRCGIFYLAMTLFAFILSLGMASGPIHPLGLGAYRFLVWLSPYNLLYKFMPGFSSIRSPYRFSIFVALFLAVLAGIGMLWICRRARSRWRWVLIVCLISVAILELWPVPIRSVKVPGTLKELPSIYQYLNKLPADAVLIEFPLPTSSSEQDMEATSRAMYFSTFHWYWLVSGYSGFGPHSHLELTDVLKNSKTTTALSALKEFGVQYIFAHWNHINDEEKRLLQTLKTQGILKPLFHEDNQHTLYKIENVQDGDTLPGFPSIERFTIYESLEGARAVTLCFYYQIETGQSLLITPWKNPIECEVSWYKNLPRPESGGELVLIKNVSYQGSELLHADSNAIAMDVPAPGPGRYRVVVRHHLSSRSVTRTGVCEIYTHGFVQFREGL